MRHSVLWSLVKHHFIIFLSLFIFSIFQMVQIQEQQDEEDRHYQQLQLPSSSSYNFMNPTTSTTNTSPLSPTLSPLPRLTATPSSPPSPPHQNDGSPTSPSSISSDHTFHGFSPSKSPHIPSPSPSPPPHSLLPVPVPVPVQNPVVSTSRLIRDQPPEAITKTESDAETGFAAQPTDGPTRGGASEVVGRKTRRPGSVLTGPRREKLVKRLGLVLRFCEIVVCLVSFSVMAADKNRGWALDSFDNYMEFRYSMTVNVIGFAYSGLQGLDLLLQLTMGKDLVRSQLRNSFDFAMDQILAYLLLSSSSSAFTRVDDWISNWGKDKFPAMASASVGVSFLAFIAFALSSLISGYVLCTHRVT